MEIGTGVKNGPDEMWEDNALPLDEMCYWVTRFRGAIARQLRRLNISKTTRCLDKYDRKHE
jgi:hypothetical protein